MKSSDLNGLVYSSESGRIRPNQKECSTLKAAHDGYVRLRREVKGRGGGTVIVISGIPLPDIELRKLAGVLKKRCGCGGTAKKGTIEIQGDHRDTLANELQHLGFKIKLAGG